MPHTETIGSKIVVEVADHPQRKDSPKYSHTRKWLMTTRPGCYICGGDPVQGVEYEDHHGGGLVVAGSLQLMTLFGMEWSGGWGADPVKVQAFVSALNPLLTLLGEETYTAPITTTAEVMDWVDSCYNASIRLCRAHHIGHPTEHSPDINGNEAVGIHHIPMPVWLLQGTNDNSKFSLFGGSTGTLVVTPHQDMDGKTVVQYAHESHPGKLKLGDVLPETHPSSRAAHIARTAAIAQMTS